MTENRQRPTPPARTAPFVTPASTTNTNGAPPPAIIVPPAPLPNTDVMTKETITTAVTEIALLLRYPERLAENPNAALKNFRQLTRAAVGDTSYHKIFKSAVTGILEKGGDAGSEMIENVQKRIDDHFAPRNDMITSVKNAKIFGSNDRQFRENYALVGVILDDAFRKHGQTLHMNHNDTKDKFVEGLTEILSGKKQPVISTLSPDERKKHILVAGLA